MRDAVGAMWIFGICLVFTIMFSAYMAISVNYGKTNQFKNSVVSVVEEHEGLNDNLENVLTQYVEEQSYNAYGFCDNDYRANDVDWSLQSCINSNAPEGTNRCNICIYKEMGTGTTDVGVPRARYRIVTFMKFDIPLIKNLFSVKVAGETRYFYDFANP